MTRLAVVFALAVAAANLFPLAAQTPAQSAQPAHVLPFDFATYQPIIPIRVNGGRAVPFLFDTGASINVIGEAIAAELGLTAGGPGQTITGGGQTSVTMRYADSVTLAATGVEWTGQRIAVLAVGAKHYSGFIGAPILMRYVVQFDFAERVIRLFDPERYEAPAAAIRIPFELQADLPVVRVQVDAGNGAVEARLMVDTGAGSVFVDLNRPFVDRHGLTEAVQSASGSDRPAGIGGTAPFIYGIGRQITLGTLVFDRPRLGLSRATQGSSSRAERDGIIGNQLLRDYLTTFDYRRRVLVLERQ
jgi:Aspartyl protease